MNFLRYLIATGLPLVPAFALADGRISGTVINKDSREPMDFVSVMVFNAKTGKPLQVIASTDEKGFFELPAIKDGEYIVKISNVGSIDQERQVKVAGTDINLGNVALADDAKLLQEVVVEGVRSQMHFELDKKVFTVDANIAAAGQSASELLESIPSVEVDQDGEVSLRGNSSVSVWINGKESGLTADNRAQILEQIPGESIDRIEVITNPSAKYSPEGTAGIINIILKKDRRGGYFGSGEIGANSYGGGNAAVNINLNSGRWEAFGSVGFRMRRNKGGSLMERDYEKEWFTHSRSVNHRRGNNLFIRAGVTYHPTDADAIALSGFGMFGHRWDSSPTTYTSNVPGNWIVNNQVTRQKGDNRGGHGELSYTHKWNDNHTLDLTGSFNYWGGPSNNIYTQVQTFEEGVLENGEIEEDFYQKQTQNINVRSWEAKADYVNMLTPWLKLETGFNGKYDRENTPVTYWQGQSENSAQLIGNLFNRFIYNNDVSALYATFGGKVKDFSFSAGVRAESWQIHTKSLSYGQTPQDVDWYHKNNFALFPSLFLSYALPYENEVQINYTRRIRRPWGGQLNSFRNLSEASSVSYGNPQLQPQYSNAFELNYIKSWTFHILSLSAYVRTSDNMINRVSFLENDILYSTFANVASEVNSGAEIVAKNSLFRSRLDLTTTLNLYNNHIDAWSYVMKSETGRDVNLSGKKQNSFAWDIRVMANVRLPWSLSLQATGRYASRRLNAQGSRQGGWGVDAGLRRVFGNLSVSLNCRNIFNSRRFKETINGIDYTQHSERWRGSRMFQLTIKYSFGNMKQKADRRNTSEPVDGGGYSDMGED